MVSIQYGGGPSIEQRQKFCNLRPGSHVPGYLGFVPQLKYQNGKTYGRETYDCAKKLPFYSGPKNPTIKHYTPQVGPSKDADCRLLFKDEIPLKKLPKPNGDNKYTEKMMPGYSGDIPHSLNKFGGTYRSICDECVDEFITDYERNQAKSARLSQLSSLFPKLRPIQGDPRVRDHMNLWSDSLMFRSKPGSAPLKSDRRAFTEPPIPGYTGYIPRMYNTELGLSARYNQASKRCLENFDQEISDHFKRFQTDMTITNNTYRISDQKPLAVQAQSEPQFSKRVFNRDGLIPAYTGHVHREKEEIGNTVGDTTRNLEVCKHDFSCYGDYVRNKDLAISRY